MWFCHDFVARCDGCPQAHACAASRGLLVAYVAFAISRAELRSGDELPVVQIRLVDVSGIRLATAEACAWKAPPKVQLPQES